MAAATLRVAEEWEAVCVRERVGELSEASLSSCSYNCQASRNTLYQPGCMIYDRQSSPDAEPTLPAAAICTGALAAANGPLMLGWCGSGCAGIVGEGTESAEEGRSLRNLPVLTL